MLNSFRIRLFRVDTVDAAAQCGVANAIREHDPRKTTATAVRLGEKTFETSETFWGDRISGWGVERG